MKPLHIASLAALALAISTPVMAQNMSNSAGVGANAATAPIRANSLETTPQNDHSPLEGVSATMPGTPLPGQGMTAAPAGAVIPMQAPTAASAGMNASAIVPAGATVTQVSPGMELISSQPIPDTPENRAKYGGPDSRAGKMTPAVGR